MRIKRILSLLAATAMAVTSLTGAMTVSASEVANGTCGDLTWTLDSDGVLTLSGNGAMATPYDWEYGVDQDLTDYPDIYTYKKEHKEDIKEVVIEEGVTSVGFCAFYQMPNLETVVLPKTISKFNSVKRTTGDPYLCYSFEECPKLKNLTLSEGMTALGGNAFYKCTALESVRIPSSLTIDGWGEGVFSGCTSLKNVTLSEGLTGIGPLAFRDTAIESIVIPSTVQKWIGRASGNNSSTTNYAFKECSKLSSVTLKEGITSIWGSPFFACPMLKRILVPASVTDITLGFTGGNLNGVPISPEFEIAFADGSQLTEIGQKTLNQVNLKALEVPESVKSNILYSNVGGSVENLYLYSEITDPSLLPKAKNVYCYSGTKQWNTAILNGAMCFDIGEEMSKTYEELSKAVEEANKYSEKDYTAESYGVLKELLEQASTKSEKSHVLGMRYLTEDINSAVKALVKKPSQGSVKPGDAKPSTDNKITNTKSQAQKNAENAMKQAKITKLTVKSKAKKKITVTWKKVSKANGYQVQVSTNKKFKKSKIILTKTTSKKKITIKKLKSKKTYFVRVRAYATYKDSNGKPQKVYSSWIKKTRKVKVK